MTSNNETVSRQNLWAGNIAKSTTSEGNKALLPTYLRMLTAHKIYFYKFVHEKVLLWGLYNKSLKDWFLGEKQLILFPSNLNIDILRNSFSTSLKVKDCENGS